MKYPKIRAEWQPFENLEINVTSQEFKIYVNGIRKGKEVFDRWVGEHEFFVPAWDEKGNLLEDPTRIHYTVEAKTDNFASEVVSSNVIELQSIAIGENPTDLKVSVMPFPQFYQEHSPSDPSTSLVASGVI